jgi:mRNA-degrading endonuclease HigB of HigAB toxin-antitoxin module
MKVIGLTDELRGDAAKQCDEGFRAWMAEAENGTWGSWEELKKQYPQASQTEEDENETHFPLGPDGTGVRAKVFFKLRLLILRCISPAPVKPRIVPRHRISLPLILANTIPIANPTI